MKNTPANSMITHNGSIRNFEPKKLLALEIANNIFAEVLRFRRAPESQESCQNLHCQKCTVPHLPKILSAVRKNKPVTFVLPAFPGKSPNLEKVLGPMPDYAERLALGFLGALCQRVKKYYSPGINMILCSDGRVFSDVVGMKDSNVTAYQVALDNLIKEMTLSDITTFNLDNYYENHNFNQMRDELLKSHGNSLEFTKQKIRNGAHLSANSDERELNRMYRGITRFLFEDSLHAGQSKSRSALQNESRSKAYEVIRRSNAWSELIAKRFPDAVRLSIHPQICGAKKLGIRLISNEIWMTPWHGVAVETKEGFILLKRSVAEALGAKLIYSSEGLPSYYQLTVKQDLSNTGLQYGI